VLFLCLVALSATAMDVNETQTLHEQLTLRNTTDCFHGTSTCNQLLHFLGSLCNTCVNFFRELRPPFVSQYYSLHVLQSRTVRAVWLCEEQWTAVYTVNGRCFFFDLYT